MPKTNRKSKVRTRLVNNTASRRAFVRRYGPMKIHIGYDGDIEEYNHNKQHLWEIWEEARRWQRENPKEE